jgi:nucleoid-associated protein YgaU
VKVAAVKSGEKVYTVRSGDTLSGIARDQLGKMTRWQEIWELNKNRIANPNLIEIGWELVLPER